MSFATLRRHRPSRSSGLSLPPNAFARVLETVRRPEVLFRAAAFIVATLVLWLVTGSGTPPFAYRRGDMPRRKIIARVDFQREDTAETEKRRQEARLTAEAVYENNPRLLEEKRQELTNKVARLVAESFDAVLANAELKNVWLELSPPLMRPEEAERQRFDALRTYFTTGMDTNRFDVAIKLALAPLERNGLLRELKHKPDEGSQVKILVFPTGNKRQTHEVLVDDVLISKVKGPLRQRLDTELKTQGSMADNAAVVADLTYTWLENRLPETLSYDQAASADEAARAVAAVQPVMIDYKAGVAELAPGGKPLGEQEISLLRMEYDEWVEQLGARRDSESQRGDVWHVLGARHFMWLLYLSSAADAAHRFY